MAQTCPNDSIRKAGRLASISLDFLFEALRYFNFGENFINMIKLLYTSFTVKVQNNGYFSDNIKIERGVHQGGCASSFYFLCCAEILAIEIRKNKNIKGVLVNNIEYILGQFADDTDASLNHDQNTFTEFMQTVNKFTAKSGLAINYDKTTVYRIGSLKDSKATLYTQKPLKWTNDPINVLGVMIHSNEQLMLTLNYNSTVSKADDIMNSWENRNISLYAKKIVINTLIASLFVYKMTVLPSMTPTMLKSINDKIEQFLWNNKRPKIDLSTLQNTASQGGIDLIDLDIKDKSIKCVWVKHLHEDPNLANLAYEVINKDLRENVWLINLEEKDVGSLDTSWFWRDVLIAWSKINFVTEVTDPYNQIVWFNSHVRISGKVVFWPKVYRQGLKYVRDIVDGDGKLIPVE